MFTRIPILAVLFNLVNPMVTRITFSIRYGMTLIFLLLCSNANAAVLYDFDWDDPAIVWPDEALARTFTNVDGSGVDMVMTVTENGVNFLKDDRPEESDLVNVPIERTLRFEARSQTQASSALGMTFELEFFETGTMHPASVIFFGMTFYDIDHHSSKHKWREQIAFSSVGTGPLTFSDVGAQIETVGRTAGSVHTWAPGEKQNPNRD